MLSPVASVLNRTRVHLHCQWPLAEWCWACHCKLKMSPLHCREPTTTLVGFSWDSSDEAKMRASFGVGRACFGFFIDLQRIAADLGYGASVGLSALAARVLAINLPKPRSVCTCLL